MQKQHLLKLLGSFFVVLLAGSWLLLATRLPGDSIVISELQNSGHLFALCLITFCLALSFKRYFFFASIVKPLFVACAVAVVFSGATEFIQMRIGREASWSDFGMDMLGVLAGLLFFLACYVKRFVRLATFCSGVLLVAYGLSSPLTWFYAKQYRDKHFPHISDFEDPWTTRFFSGSYSGRYSIVRAPEEWKNNRSHVARVDFRPSKKWPGIKSFDLRGNWDNYQVLVFEVFNPQDEELRLVLRLHDEVHNNRHNDRFNQTFRLGQGEHNIRVPIEKIANTRSGRRLKMGKIRVMMLYMNRPESSYTLYFDNFRLE